MKVTAEKMYPMRVTWQFILSTDMCMDHIINNEMLKKKARSPALV